MNMWRGVRYVLFVLACAAVVSGCRVDAIWVSNPDGLNFEMSRAPRYLGVANHNPEIPELIITLEPDKDWILVEPRQVRSAAPNGSIRDEQEVVVQIDRSLLTRAGTHRGQIMLRAPGVNPVSVAVSVIQEEAPPKDDLSIVNPSVVYSRPYLIEFGFALRDKENRAVVGTPAQFTVNAREDAQPVGDAQGLSLRRGAARQLWLELVLDYSIVMQQVEGAIAEMEYAATEILLPSLNADALVAVSEFHRDDQSANLVIDFNMDKNETAARIRDIQGSYVRGFASGARMYDALLEAVRRFGHVSAGANDERYIVLFSNGRDTSSTTTEAQVVTEALARRVRIIAVGFGEMIDSGALLTLASLTRGRYIPAERIENLQPAFQRIVEDLEAQYVVRWASLRRDSRAVIPAFDITFGGATASHTASRSFRATEYVGDPLAGRLTLVQADTPNRTTVILRANYTPRGIGAVHCWVRSDHDFTVTLVGPADDGLMAAWSLAQEPAEGGWWITAESDGASLPFAAFGPMMRFDFDQAVDSPFTAFEIDNDIYMEGQMLHLE